MEKLLHSRITVVCANTEEAHEGFVGDSVAVVLSLQMPDVENGEYLLTLPETTYT